MKTGLPGLMFAVAHLLSPWNNIACWASGLWADEAAGHGAPGLGAGPKENLFGRLGNSSRRCRHFVTSNLKYQRKIEKSEPFFGQIGSDALKHFTIFYFI